MTVSGALQSSDTSIHPRYRADIDGLRAVAVLAVVGYHAFPERVPGGFVGVDIFFVISGFLISMILLAGLEQQTFSFTDFYSRRIRRIFPALFVTLVAVLAFGWVALQPGEFRQLGKHALAGSGFAVNFTLWDESGYFDAAAEAKPLLHLWSLGIEEQFYIVWPLALWLTSRAGVSFLIPIAGIGGASFLANVMTVQARPVDAFYFPHTRFWELMIGSALAYAALRSRQPRRWTRPTVNAVSGTGLGLIAVSLAAVNTSSAFPGWWALLPTTGAALLIQAGPQAWVNRVILSARPVVWIGLISYPLYLWHWPLLSYARILVNPEGSADIDPSRGVRISLVLAALALSWLTYSALERPIRTGHHGGAKAAGLVTAMVLVGAMSWSTFASGGHPGRVNASKARHDGAPQLQDAHVQSLPSYAAIFRGVTPAPGRDIFQARPVSASHFDVAVIGDSHAWVLYDGLSKSMQAPITVVGRGTCPPLVNVDGTRRDGRTNTPLHCQPLVDNTLAYFSGDAETDVIVLTAYFEQYQREIRLTKAGQAGIALAEALRDTLTLLGRSGKTIVVAYDVPEIPRSCYRRQFPVWDRQPRGDCTIARDRYEAGRSGIADVVRQVSAEFPNVTAYDPANALCDAERCGEIDAADFLYLSDGHHVNTVGAERLGADVARFIERLLHSR